MSRKPRILLLSAYQSISQKHWCDFLCNQLPEFDWTLCELPPRFFAWRLRGNPLSFLNKYPELVDSRFDAVIATSTVDLSVIKSLAPVINRCPSALYFHENQFAYPKSNQPQQLLDLQMVNLYSAMSADNLWFNSEYNADTFYSGVDNLLKKMPDFAPKALSSTLKTKAIQLPVPISSPAHGQDFRNPNWIIWNHRWEWDKGPELLAAIVAKSTHLPYQFVLTGQQFRTKPSALQQLLAEFPDKVVHAGYVENREEYQSWLRQCGIVLSTADHEFQGIAVLEAIAHGCTPLLPSRLSYPELVSDEFLYSANNDLNQQADAAVDKLTAWLTDRPSAPDVSHYFETNLVEPYRNAIRQLLSQD